MTIIKVFPKSFNQAKVMELLASYPEITEVHWPGFITLDPRRYIPIGTKIRTYPGFISPGEIRFVTTRALTGSEEAALNTMLTNHDYTVLTTEQTLCDNDETDIMSVVLTGYATYMTHMQNWDSYNAAQTKTASKECLVVLGKVIRYYLRQVKDVQF